MPIYIFKKTSILSRAKWSHVIFIKFIIKNSLLSCPYLVRNMSIRLKLYYIMGQKSNQDALSLRFFTKKLLLSCAFLSKKRTFSKEHTLLTTIFCQKTVHFLKNTMLSCQVFQNFHEKPPAAMPIFGQKNINSVKALLHFWPKGRQDARSF